MDNVIERYQWFSKKIIGHNIKFWSLLKKHIEKNHISNKELSGFKFSIFDSIEFVSTEVWDKVNCGKDIFLSSDYLKALEKAAPKNMTFKYSILYEENTPAAIAYFQILTLDNSLHESLIADGLKNKEKLYDKIHSKVRKNISLKMLVCGNALLSGEHGFAAIPGMNQSKLSKGISEVIEKIRYTEKICGKVDVILIKDFYANKKYNNNVFTDAGYYDYSAGPNMAVPIRENWKSFNDYLMDMKTKYRKRITSAVKKGEYMIRKSLTYDEIGKNKAELYRLYLQVADKAKLRLFVLNPDMLLELKRFLKNKFVLDAYYVDDKIVAYTTRIFNEDVIEGYSHGLDYVLNKKYEIYQNILIDDIKEGIKNKSKKINLGRTSIGMKSSIGAVPEDMKFFVQSKVAVPNILIKKISYFLKPSEEHCRNPFV